MEIIKEETISLVEEDDINIQRVTDIDQMVKNLLSTKALKWVPGGVHVTRGLTGDKAREQYLRENLNDIVQLIVNGEIYHYFITSEDLADPQGGHVEDDSIIWDKLDPMLNKFHNAGSSGMKPQPPEFPKLKNITIHSSGEHAVLNMGEEWQVKNGKRNIDREKYLMDLLEPHLYPDEIGDGVAVFERPETHKTASGKQSFRDFFKDLKYIDNDWSYRDENGALEEQKTKLTKTRLMEIIKEETRVFLESQYDPRADYYSADDPTYQALKRRRERLKAQDAVRKAKKDREAADAKARSKNRAVWDELYDLVSDNFDPDVPGKTTINTILKIIDDGLPEVKAGLDGDFGPGTTEQGVIDIVKDLKGIREVLNPKDGAGAYVKDFKKSKAPQFKGKSGKKKKEMADAAYMQDKKEGQ